MHILTSDILVLRLISVLVFILFSSQNFYYPRRARSALGVDTVLTLDVCLYVCMFVCMFVCMLGL